MYERAGVEATVRTLGVDDQGSQGPRVGSSEENGMKFVAGLTCHLCGATYPPKASWVCSECLGPLEVTYDYDAVREGHQPRAH